MDVIRAKVAHLCEAAPLFAAYREFYGEPYDLEAATAFLNDRLTRDESIVLLAREGHATVGFTQIYPAFSSTRLAPIWILNDLFVAPDARGHGAVDELLKTAATLALEAGNLRAQAVYDRHGYATDEHYRHYEKPLD